MSAVRQSVPGKIPGTRFFRQTPNNATGCSAVELGLHKSFSECYQKRSYIGCPLQIYEPLQFITMLFVIVNNNLNYLTRFNKDIIAKDWTGYRYPGRLLGIRSSRRQVESATSISATSRVGDIQLGDNSGQLGDISGQIGDKRISQIGDNDRKRQQREFEITLLLSRWAKYICVFILLYL